MTVTVELYGIARERVGQAETTVAATTLGDALRNLADAFPDFARDCTDCVEGQVRLKSFYVASLAGECFVSNPATPIPDGKPLLILSADAGG